MWCFYIKLTQLLLLKCLFYNYERERIILRGKGVGCEPEKKMYGLFSPLEVSSCLWDFFDFLFDHHISFRINCTGLLAEVY
ncbi:hypothetical protein EZV62_013088 [Acer yangbiense]|uniref:Secreted protein n=1 Tax=Acer yangbiense TaxID=1000413 RepID=A0A5C7HY08_9ROSI|nr:hypothetical protein EZV62_013088 [Acer yangbiense]